MQYTCRYNKIIFVHVFKNQRDLICTPITMKWWWYNRCYNLCSKIPFLNMAYTYFYKQYTYNNILRNNCLIQVSIDAFHSIASQFRYLMTKTVSNNTFDTLMVSFHPYLLSRNIFCLTHNKIRVTMALPQTNSHLTFQQSFWNPHHIFLYNLIISDKII